MPPCDVHELRIAPRCPDRHHVAKREETSRAIHNCRPRPMAPASVALAIASPRRAPPSKICSVSARWTGTTKPASRLDALFSIRPALRRRRKKRRGRRDDAAKAIDRPKTIWISRRNPPEVSPKASASPVAMMMITATILATGP